MKEINFLIGDLVLIQSGNHKATMEGCLCRVERVTRSWHKVMYGLKEITEPGIIPRFCYAYQEDIILIFHGDGYPREEFEISL